MSNIEFDRKKAVEKKLSSFVRSSEDSESNKIQEKKFTGTQNKLRAILNTNKTLEDIKQKNDQISRLVSPNLKGSMMEQSRRATLAIHN